MNRRDFLYLLTAAGANYGLAGCFSQSAQKHKPDNRPDYPNLVIILADDLGYGDPGCYNEQSKIPTPNIDKLASQGMRFTDAHTPSSVCTPTRYGLLTGRYCWRTPLKSSVLWPWDEPLIEPDRLTLPQMLRQHGYNTACIGKWHLGWNWATKDNSRINDQIKIGQYNEDLRTSFSKKIDFTQSIEDGPVTRGFDYYFGDDVPNFPPYCFIENNRVVQLPTEDKPQDMFGHPGPMQPGWELDDVMPKLTEKAVQYLNGRVKSPDQPFFLYFPLTAPHTPIAPDETFIGKSQAGSYGDYVHQVDFSVGQVMAALERLGLGDKTLLIFTSDNGSPQRDGTHMSGPIGSVKRRFGHDPSRPWRGMKGDIWEAGHRVPFIARWPGKITPGTTSDELICLSDLMATCGAIVGYDLPDNAAEDSFDILPALLGNKNSTPIRKDIIHHSGNGVFAIRQGDWKLILGKGSGGFTPYKPPQGAPPGQLYNLAHDPAEKNNLYEKNSDIVERLTTLLKHYQQPGLSGKS
jgi:arylsulfatase A